MVSPSGRGGEWSGPSVSGCPRNGPSTRLDAAPAPATTWPPDPPLRSRIVLGCAAGKSNKEVAAEAGVWPQTVCKWRQRFVESRLDGLVDEPRPGTRHVRSVTS